jgi:hypothetical protein
VASQGLGPTLWEKVMAFRSSIAEMLARLEEQIAYNAEREA